MLRCHIAFVLAAVVLNAGCSGRVRTYPVSGAVRFDDGQPARVGVIEFRSQSGVTSRAKLDETGSFNLGTFGAADGAPAGTYRVIIVQYFDAEPPKHVHTHDDHDEREADDHDASNHAGEPDARVARRFSEYSTSTLTAMVRPDAENKFDFVVTHPPQPILQSHHK